MLPTSRLHYLCLALLIIFSSCAPMGGRAREEALVSQIHVGDSRAQVEKILGQPYAVEEHGRTTTMTYVSADSGSTDQSQVGAGVLSSVLGSLGSFGGGGRGLGAASQVGSQAISMSSQLNNSSSGSIEHREVKVKLRGDKVISVDHVGTGRVGIGAGS